MIFKKHLMVNLMLKKSKTLLVAMLCLILVFLTACNEEAAVNSSKPIKTQVAISQKPISLPQEPRFNRILDSEGRINTNYLVSTTSTVIKKNYDNRVYIEQNGKPFFYNPVYISYDQILNNQYIPAERKAVVLEEAFAKAKENGFKTVALYVDWKNFFDGKNYNFEYYKIYYKLAEKYDLYVSIIWNGYSKNGFMPWQTDPEKYPPLLIDGAPLKASVPDLSESIYIAEACEAIEQFCAWLNYFDYNHRTVLLQLEDEASSNYGKGAWLSQYLNYSDLLLQMAETVKQSKFNVVTTVGITFDDYKLNYDGLSGRERWDKFLDSEYVDGIGASSLVGGEYNVGNFANDDKFCYISKLSPATYDFFKTALQFLEQGYQFGVYELKSFDLNINCGMYRTHSTRWDVRSRQIVDRGILGKKRLFEADTVDVIDFIKGINSFGDVLAYTSLLDVITLNRDTSNDFVFLSKISDFALSFNNTANPSYVYNSAGICAIDPYSNIYVFAFRGTPALAVDCDYWVSIVEGSVIDGVWTPSSEPILVEDHRFIMKSGVTYKIILTEP